MLTYTQVYDKKQWNTLYISLPFVSIMISLTDVIVVEERETLF